ncbi:hypothetical protein [Bosea rubneri]|uniref:Uncharacterized protein n=1 Tax=Bosea rubneri TaxID=3075434 RepID=A0ABU3SDD4_9HYPH|nr:hypothetical protein [Bosea sp. ZW T0_25]MDU0342402.1 hypothetical protein [Bosea sp. ZW T0_25]
MPKGQTEAATSLGLRYWPTTIKVVLPQAPHNMLPSMVNDNAARGRRHLGIGRVSRRRRSEPHREVSLEGVVLRILGQLSGVGDAERRALADGEV